MRVEAILPLFALFIQATNAVPVDPSELNTAGPRHTGVLDAPVGYQDWYEVAEKRSNEDQKSSLGYQDWYEVAEKRSN